MNTIKNLDLQLKVFLISAFTLAILFITMISVYGFTEF